MKPTKIIGLLLAVFAPQYGAWAQSNAISLYPEKPSIVLDGVGFPMAFDVGDLNRDGKPDLAVASRSMPGQTGRIDKIDIYYQKDGGFKQPPDREIRVPAFPLRIGDFDKDGTNDLAVSGNPLHLFLGKDNLATHYEHSDGNGGFGLAAGKIGAHGTYDFLMGPVWHIWSEKNIIAFDSGYFRGPRQNDNRSSFLCDLDGDGHTDVVFTGAWTNWIRLYYGPFLATTVNPRELSQFVELKTPCNISGVTAGDLNGDGRPDLIASSVGASEPKVLIYYQNAPLDFYTNALPSLVITGVNGIVTAADVNRDGRDDLLVAEHSSRNGRIFIFLQKQGRPFATRADQADQVLATGLNQSLRVTDVNGDGYPDLVTSWPYGQGSIRIYLNKGEGR